MKGRVSEGLDARVYPAKHFPSAKMIPNEYLAQPSPLFLGKASASACIISSLCRPARILIFKNFRELLLSCNTFICSAFIKDIHLSNVVNGFVPRKERLCGRPLRVLMESIRDSPSSSNSHSLNMNDWRPAPATALLLSKSKLKRQSCIDSGGFCWFRNNTQCSLLKGRLPAKTSLLRPFLSAYDYTNDVPPSWQEQLAS
jgi:hypothetical protein